MTRAALLQTRARTPAVRASRRLALGIVAAGVALASAAPVAAQETATWYITTYTNDILVWDEASEEIVGRITVRNPIPTGVDLNESKTRLYVGEASGERMEIVDLASREVIDEFTLSHDSVTVRIDGFAAHPSDERAVIFAKRYTKLSDRFVVEGPFLLEYDLTTKSVTDTIPWPEGEPLENVGFRYAPDGETLYFFTDDIIVVDADSYEEVDRWDISRPLEAGLGRPSFSTNSGTYDQEGVATGLYRMRDPVQNRNMMGIATVRLADEEVDFFTLGPTEPVTDFALAPGGERAFAIYTTIDRYEFWEFDIPGERVVRKVPFSGRPRMNLRVSADGEKLYVYQAGNTIDVYDADTFELMRSVEFDADMLGTVVIRNDP